MGQICHIWISNDEIIDIKQVREKQLKRWKRKWKIDLIQKYNPDFDDPYFPIQQQDLT